MNQPVAAQVSVNGRSYRLPAAPLVVVCIDGSEPGYIERAAEAGLTPCLAAILAMGTNRLADGVVPSFTNPNHICPVDFDVTWL